MHAAHSSLSSVQSRSGAMANRMGGVGKAAGDQNEDAHKLQVALRGVFNEVDTG